MVCESSDNQINPPIIPPTGSLFGFPTAQIPQPFDIDLPFDMIEDIKDFIDRLSLDWPGGKLVPDIGNFTKEIFDAISNILTKMAPFLSFYSFIMALFKLILCIIEVLCAIPNPFKIANAMVKLFTECLPPFLNIFPWLALILMIIAFLLLVLALIEYIIAKILGIIEEIIRNIIILAKGTTFQDVASTLAAIQKIAELLCFIQNIMAIFVALAAIIAIIQSLAMIGGGPVCDDETAGGCCSPDVCPPFIKNSPWTGTSAKLLYNKQVGPDYAEIFASLGLSEEVLAFMTPPEPPRRERWQLMDDAESGAYKFSDITTPVLDITQFPPVVATFWPEGVTYDSTTPSSRAPYNVDLRFEVDPSQFHATDTLGTRYMRVNGCITVRKPTNFSTGYHNLPDTSQGLNGTLYLEGGLVFEDDGETPFEVDGEQATLNTFIHEADAKGTSLPEDTITFTNIEYTFKPMYGVLMGHTLITAGCLPEVAAEKAVMNAVIIAEDVRAVVEKLAPVPIGTNGLPSISFLPNVTGGQECVLASLDRFRANVSLETSALFQADIVACLGDLREQALAAVCGAITTATSQFKSEVAIEPDIQFTTRSIEVAVLLKDPTGTVIAGGLPVSCQTEIANKVTGEVSLGKISNFTYDSGTGLFKANITSAEPGTGTLTVLFNNKVFNTVVAPTDTSNSQIVENETEYTFIGATDEAAIRRNVTDVSGGE